MLVGGGARQGRHVPPHPVLTDAAQTAGEMSRLSIRDVRGLVDALGEREATAKGEEAVARLLQWVLSCVFVGSVTLDWKWRNGRKRASREQRQP